MEPIDRLFDLLERGAARLYGGETVSQLEHALQCATLAEESGAAPVLVTAALFHDLGHLVHELGAEPAARGIDDRHEHAGAALLARWFGDATCIPVRLHVDAKRYLCAVEPDYFATLSAASVRSLALQGGALAAEEATRFAEAPYARDAIALRRWDEGAKLAGLKTPPIEHFRPIVAASLRQDP
jgi:phosphonate degradation associated HDIG domain protein